ncbi:hypothetical protein T10_158 [Trichinella papuae]|uniref:Uncharacterized protein n=1 Tax=Trichinella papuae TaxID=268474 RepID=A0A0V1MK48_9BILA|nr:hypothetical protein T10_158 [Trichinella papuae]
MKLKCYNTHSNNNMHVVNNFTKNGNGLITNLTVELNHGSQNNTELIENVTKTSTAVTKRIDFTEKIEITNNNLNEKTDEKCKNNYCIINGKKNNKAYGNDKISETPSGNTESAGSGFKLNSTDKNTSSIICVLPVNHNGTIRYIELNQTYINITSCEEDNNNNIFCIAVSIGMIGICLMTIIIFCLCHFKPMKMMRKRAEEKKIENNQSFCISAAAEQMLSVEEKFS